LGLINSTQNATILLAYDAGWSPEASGAAHGSEMAMYYVYIIYSKDIDKYYVGYTHDVDLRLSQHNSTNSYYSKTTAKACDWNLVHVETLIDKSVAIKREKQIKKWKSRKKILELINDAGWSSGSSRGS